MGELLSRRDDHVLGDLVQAVDEAVDRVDRSNEAHLAEFFRLRGKGIEPRTARWKFKFEF